MKRFDNDATTIEGAINYMKNRAIQLIKFGYRLNSIEAHEWGIDATFCKGSKDFQSLYILAQYRNNGHFLSNVNKTILTSKECNISSYLDSKGVKYVMVDLTVFNEYKMIEDYYRDGKAERSGAYFMNHIDEGLSILNNIGASDIAKKAYCLHPIFQSDEELFRNYHKSLNVSPLIMMTVMEYRSVANEYLSTRKINSIDEIRLSPLKYVNDMLRADKIQNYKDFMLYHYNKHPRSEELTEYFINWHNKLEINETDYKLIPNYTKL